MKVWRSSKVMGMIFHSSSYFLLWVWICGRIPSVLFPLVCCPININKILDLLATRFERGGMGPSQRFFGLGSDSISWDFQGRVTIDKLKINSKIINDDVRAVSGGGLIPGSTQDRDLGEHWGEICKWAMRLSCVLLGSYVHEQSEHSSGLQLGSLTNSKTYQRHIYSI